MIESSPGKEKRSEPRLPFPMHAVPIVTGFSPWKVIDVSPGGAGLVGQSIPDIGETISVRLTAPFLERQGSTIDVVATVEVVRHIFDDKNRLAGIGVAWLSLVSRGPAHALRDFLRGILCIPEGFLRRLSGEETWEYVFARTARPKTIRLSAETPPASQQPAVETNTDSGVARAPRLTTSTQVMFPVTFQSDKTKGAGFAVKVMVHAMRVATTDNPPDPYARIKIGVKVGEQTLDLAGTVGNVRKSAEPGKESRFDIQLSLGNNPTHLSLYRKALEKIAGAT